MGLMDWFKRARGSKDAVITPGGSLMQDPGELKRSREGELEREYSAEREAAYEELWGEPDSISHEVISLIPHVDIYLYPSEYEDRPFVRLVTSGMSDLPMVLPDQTRVRTELVMYVPEVRDSYLNMLRFLAHYPHDNGRWLYHGHTIPNGHPPEPFFDNSSLCVALLSDTLVTSDRQLSERLIVEGTPVELLWLNPITQAECELKLEQGSEALYEAFDQHQLHFILDEQRASCV